MRLVDLGYRDNPEVRAFVEQGRGLNHFEVVAPDAEATLNSCCRSLPLPRGGDVKLPQMDCRDRVEGERVGRLATVSGAAQPHLVPVTFAIVDARIVIGVDEKPKSTYSLKRLRNIRKNPRVSILWDHYAEDWSRLWWIRADGSATVQESGSVWTNAWSALNQKYQQYGARSHIGPVVVVDVARWSGWSYS